MKNKILKKVYLLLATVFLGILLKITTIQAYSWKSLHILGA